jgi:hypothetical protein
MVQEMLPQFIEVFGFDIWNPSKNIAFYVHRSWIAGFGSKAKFRAAGKGNSLPGSRR